MAVPRGDALDAYLGDPSKRYFGTGYRNVRHLVRSRMGDAPLVGNARVRYPASWSLDAGGSRRTPHLSSIDAVILSVLMLERSATSIGASQLAGQYVSTVDLKAGATPWEALEEVPVDLVSNHSPEPQVTGTVGNIRVKVGLADAELLSATGGEGRSVYGDLVRTTRCRTTDTFHDENDVLSGHHFADFAGTGDARGLEAGNWPNLTMVDYMVTLGQMTQALVYSAHNLSRASAGPLWMRTMRLSRHRAHAGPTPLRFTSNARIVRDRMIDRGGQRIHNVHVAARTSCGVQAFSTLAYTEMAPR